MVYSVYGAVYKVVYTGRWCLGAALSPLLAVALHGKTGLVVVAVQGAPICSIVPYLLAADIIMFVKHCALLTCCRHYNVVKYCALMAYITTSEDLSLL